LFFCLKTNQDNQKRDKNMLLIFMIFQGENENSISKKIFVYHFTIIFFVIN